MITSCDIPSTEFEAYIDDSFSTELDDCDCEECLLSVITELRKRLDTNIKIQHEVGV